MIAMSPMHPCKPNHHLAEHQLPVRAAWQPTAPMQLARLTTSVSIGTTGRVTRQHTFTRTLVPVPVTLPCRIPTRLRQIQTP